MLASFLQVDSLSELGAAEFAAFAHSYVALDLLKDMGQLLVFLSVRGPVVLFEALEMQEYSLAVDEDTFKCLTTLGGLEGKNLLFGCEFPSAASDLSTK